MIEVREFTKSDEEQVRNLIDEINAYDGNFEGMDNIGRMEDFDEFLQTTEKNKYHGDIYFYQFTEGVKKFVIPDGNCIVDEDYKWLEFYDYSSKIKLTAFYDDKNVISELYFDIARGIGKESGLPYEDDMYLDVLVTDDGEIILLDEDELKEALEKKQITKAEFENAYKEAYQLMDRLQNKKQELQNFTDKYLRMLLEE